MKNNKGSTLPDVIAALFLLTIISLTVYSTIAFQWRTISNLEVAEKMDRIVKDELIVFSDEKLFSNKKIEAFEITYSKKFFRTENERNFYLVELEITHESGLPRRSYEFITKE